MTCIRRPIATAMLTVMTALTFAPGVRAACWSAAERQAIAVRVLQSEITVGALTCGIKHAYAAFVNQQETQLRRHGGTLSDYYTSAYGDNAGQRKLDALVTRLANEASQRKTRWPSGYCDFVFALTHRAAATPPERLAEFASAQPPGRRASTLAVCD